LQQQGQVVEQARGVLATVRVSGGSMPTMFHIPADKSVLPNRQLSARSRAKSASLLCAAIRHTVVAFEAQRATVGWVTTNTLRHFLKSPMPIKCSIIGNPDLLSVMQGCSSQCVKFSLAFSYVSQFLYA
jgi:hypothetical protein